MVDWLVSLPIWQMALLVFGATYLVAAVIHVVVIRLAVGDRARAFKTVSAGLLPPPVSPAIPRPGCGGW